MYQSFKKSLSNWNSSTTEREKLQHTYIAVATILLVIAGIFGLLDRSLGQQILAGAIAAAGIFLINAIAWALLQSFVLLRVTPEKPHKPEAKPPRKASTKK